MTASLTHHNRWTATTKTPMTASHRRRDGDTNNHKLIKNRQCVLAEARRCNGPPERTTNSPTSTITTTTGPAVQQNCFFWNNDSSPDTNSYDNGALSMDDDIDDMDMDARCCYSSLIDLGECQTQLGHLGEARRLYERALRLQRTQCPTESLLYRSGHRNYQAACQIDWEDVHDLASCLQDLGKVCALLEDVLAARMHLTECLQLKRIYFAELAQTEHSWDCYGTTAESSRCSKKRNCNHSIHSQQQREQHNNNLDLACLLEELADVCSTETATIPADFTAAQRHYNEALNCKRLFYAHKQQHACRLMGMKQQVYGYDVANADIAYTVFRLAQAARKTGRLHKARKKYAEAVSMYTDGNSNEVVHFNRTLCFIHLSQVNVDLKKQEMATMYLDQAVSELLMSDKRTAIRPAAAASTMSSPNLDSAAAVHKKTTTATTTPSVSTVAQIAPTAVSSSPHVFASTSALPFASSMTSVKALVQPSCRKDLEKMIEQQRQILVSLSMTDKKISTSKTTIEDQSCNK